MATYTWVSRDASYSIRFTLGADGVVVEAPNGKSFEPYTAIRGVQLTPAMTNFGPVTAIWLNRKQLGLAVTIAVRGPYPPADAGQVAAYNNWVKALHATLIDRELVPQITFRCGTHVNRWGDCFRLSRSPDECPSLRPHWDCCRHHDQFVGTRHDVYWRRCGHADDAQAC